jgi:molybdopterin converting factor subunit 1
MSKSINIKYFAVLREQRGCGEETVDTDASTAAALYSVLQTEHKFELNQSSLKVAINDAFCDWDTELKAGDSLVFIPPVAGG